MQAVSAAMSRLFRFKSGPDPKVILDHDLDNELALSAESPDAVTWTIKLRSGASFHAIAPVNGHAVEAEDVKATFVRALDPKGANRGSLGMIDPAQIQTPFKDTVVFKLKYAYAPFPKTLASPTYSWILAREAEAGGYDPAKQIIGSGPFMFDSYTPDVALTYKRNPAYFEKGLPHVEAVNYAIIPDAAQQTAQFTAGNLEFLAPDANDLATLKRAKPNATYITALNSSGGGYPLYFPMGASPSPFQDLRVRQAVSLVIDRTALSNAFDQSQSVPAFAVPPGMGKWALKMEDLNASLQQYFKFDLAQAKKLLGDAGASDASVKLAWAAHYLGPAYDSQAQADYNMLTALPWKIALQPVDYNKDWIAAGKGMRYGNFPGDTFVFSGISTYTEADEFLFNYFHSKSPTNQERLSDPRLDAMIDKARGIINDDERVAAYKDVQRYLAQQMYAVYGMPQGHSYYAVQPWVRGYNFSNTYGLGTEVWSRLWLNK